LNRKLWFALLFGLGIATQPVAAAEELSFPGTGASQAVLRAIAERFNE